MTVAQGQPGGIAGARAVLQPERAALVVGAVQAHAQVFPFALESVCGYDLCAQVQLRCCLTQPTYGQAPVLVLGFQQVAAAFQAFQAQRFRRRRCCAGSQREQRSEGSGS
ncbi:hypothetical protein D3C76_1196520 [compost metagenome]